MSHQPSRHETSGYEEYQRLLSLLDERRFDEAQARGRFLLEQPETGDLVRSKVHNLLCWIFIEGLKRAAPEAALHAEEAVRVAGELQEYALQMQAMFNLASAYYQIGNYQMAQNLYEALLPRLDADTTVIPLGRVICRHGLAQVALVQGQTDDALKHLDIAQALCADEEAPFMLAECYRRRALVYLRTNQPEQAAWALEQINEAELAAGPRSLWWKLHFRFTKARVEMAQGHWATAKPLVVNTMALACEMNDMPVLAECTCLLALLEQAEGRKSATKRARTALTCAIYSGRRDVVDDVRERLKDLLVTDL